MRMLRTFHDLYYSCAIKKCGMNVLKFFSSLIASVITIITRFPLTSRCLPIHTTVTRLPVCSSNWPRCCMTACWFLRCCLWPPPWRWFSITARLSNPVPCSAFTCCSPCLLFMPGSGAIRDKRSACGPGKFASFRNSAATPAGVAVICG